MRGAGHAEVEMPKFVGVQLLLASLTPTSRTVLSLTMVSRTVLSLTLHSRTLFSCTLHSVNGHLSSGHDAYKQVGYTLISATRDEPYRP